MSRDEPAYHSYLLRLWRAADHEKPLWRASLEEPATGKRVGFIGLEALFAFLRGACGLGSAGVVGDNPPVSPTPRQPSDAAPSNLSPPEEVSE